MPRPGAPPREGQRGVPSSRYLRLRHPADPTPEDQELCTAPRTERWRRGTNWRWLSPEIQSRSLVVTLVVRYALQGPAVHHPSDLHRMTERWARRVLALFLGAQGGHHLMHGRLIVPRVFIELAGSAEPLTTINRHAITGDVPGAIGHQIRR